jgi:hypothetical protein
LPNVNIIKTQMNSVSMNVVTQRQIDASTAGLLAALASLPPLPGKGADYRGPSYPKQSKARTS